MQIRYGNYTHALGEPALSIDRETLFTDALTPWAERVRWTIAGVITNQGGTEATLNAKVRNLETAYSVPNRDLALLLTSGVAAAGHSITNSATIGGVRIIKPPHYPKGDGVEGVTMRTFGVVLEAIVAVSSSTALLSWTETIKFSGGGPEYGYLQPLTGKPIRQRLRQHSIYRASQQGSAVGLYSYPLPGSSLWPVYQLATRKVDYRSPKRQGYSSGADVNIEFLVSWAYQFASDNQLTAANGPRRWTQ